jgi:alanine dehydrogenase
MPGAVARTSTIGLTNATMPFVLDLANHGTELALTRDQHLMNGLNIYQGHVCCRAVAIAQGLDYVDPKTLIH